MFQLESVPRTLLLEVFSFINLEVLIEIRFLNKNLFNIVSVIIYQHLKYSNCSIIDTFEEIQEDFIIKNSHVIESLHVKDYFKSGCLSKCGGVSNILNRFPNLRRLDLMVFKNIDESLSEILNNYKSVLFNIEFLVLVLDSGFIVDKLHPFLNPNKIKSLRIDTLDTEIIINDMMKFNRFIKLEELSLTGADLTIYENDLINHNTIILPSLKSLSCKVNIFKGNLDMFGNMMQLKTLILGPPTHSENEKQFIKQNKQLADLYLAYNFSYEFEIGIKEILERIKPILNIERTSTIVFSGINDYCLDGGVFMEKVNYFGSSIEGESDSDVFMNMDSNNNVDNSIAKSISTENDNSVEDSCNSNNGNLKVNNIPGKEHNVVEKDSPSKVDDEGRLLFLLVYTIRFFNCTLDIKFISKLLTHFPNVKKIIFEDCQLTNDENITLNLPNNRENYLICIDKNSLEYENYSPFKLFEGYNKLIIN